jgi:hypothetical protein
MAQEPPPPDFAGRDDLIERNAIEASASSITLTRTSLIAKELLFSPARSDTAFTAPLFDAFTRRMWLFWFPDAAALNRME